MNEYNSSREIYIKLCNLNLQLAIIGKKSLSEQVSNIMTHLMEDGFEPDDSFYEEEK